jgi:hypothetical protein
MPPETVPVSQSRAWVPLLIAFIIAFDVAAFFQWADGAFQSEFGGHPDEAANYLTGLRLRETVMQNPAAALRHTSAFGIMQGGWMLAFGTSRTAALLLMAALAASATTVIFGTVRREFGTWAAAVASFVWLCAPAVRASYETILPELAGALVITAAALLCARLVDRYPRGAVPRSSEETPPSPGKTDATRGWRSIACKWIRAVALLVGGGVLAYATAVALGLVPGEVRSASCFLRESAPVLGVAAAAFAVLGAVLHAPQDAQSRTRRIALTALVAGVLLAAWLRSGDPEMRILVLASPALAMLAVHGAVSLAGIVGSQAAIAAEYPRRRALWLLLLLLLALPPALMHPWQKQWNGFAPIALALLEETPGPARVLVVSDPRGEGMLISETAMRDPAHQITFERGSETLTEPSSPAPRGRPQERFMEDEPLLAHLTSGGIRYIVLDSSVPEPSRAGYHDQMIRVLGDNARSFWPIGDSPLVRDGEPMGHPLRIFRVMQSDGAQLR